MKRMIEELWYGNVLPKENPANDNSHLRKLLGYISRHRAELEESLNDEQKAILRKLTDNQNEYDSLAKAKIFAFGFRLGCLLMLDVMKDEARNEKDEI